VLEAKGRKKGRTPSERGTDAHTANPEVDAILAAWRANDPSAGPRLAELPAEERHAALRAFGYRLA
jgi:hypothetical protein